MLLFKHDSNCTKPHCPMSRNQLICYRFFTSFRVSECSDHLDTFQARIRKKFDKITCTKNHMEQRFACWSLYMYVLRSKDRSHGTAHVKFWEGFVKECSKSKQNNIFFTSKHFETLKIPVLLWSFNSQMIAEAIWSHWNILSSIDFLK